jgi:hypothetical protein
MDNPNIMTRLHNALKQDFTPAESKQILESYSLSSKLSQKQQYDGLLLLSSDLRFYLQVLKVAEGWKRRKDSCFRYHFHQVSE